MVRSIRIYFIRIIFSIRYLFGPRNLTKIYDSGDRSQVRRRETNLGSFLADAVADDLDINLVFINGGGIRGGIPVGNVSNSTNVLYSHI